MKDIEILKSLEKRLKIKIGNFQEWDQENEGLNKKQLAKFDNSQNVEGLYLNSIGLEQIPEEVLKFKKLKTLHLFRNQLTTIPNELANLEHLEEVLFIENKISHIPEEIVFKNNLKVLSIHQNPVKNIPEEVISLSLIHI